MKFLLLQAALQPDQPASAPPLPFLVMDPSDHRRYVGVEKVRCTRPAAKGDGCMCPSKAAHYAPARTVVPDAPTLRTEIGAGTLTLLGELDADNITAARAAAKEA